MAKFYGKIGYAVNEEVEPGIWEDVIHEKECCGDLLQNYKKQESSGGINDDVNISSKISIIADPYATEHIFSVRYVKFIMPKLGGAWKVTDIDPINSPRITLTVGGVYNGEQARIADQT